MKKECVNKEENKKGCPCTYEPCDKKGICCECISYHWAIDQFPACFFSPEVERTYDRSIRRFISTYKPR